MSTSVSLSPSKHTTLSSSPLSHTIFLPPCVRQELTVAVHAVVGTAPIDVYLKTLRRKQLEEYHAAFEGEDSLLHDFCCPLDPALYLSLQLLFLPLFPLVLLTSSFFSYSPPPASRPPSILLISFSAAKAGGHSMPPRSQSDVNMPPKGQGQGQGGANSSKY
jgi:hypothetical protein